MAGEKDRGFWTLALGAALIAVGTIYGSGGKASDTALHAAAPPPAAAPLAASDSTGRAPAVSPSRAGVTASVYECRVHGRHVFSDAPCGPDAQVHRIQSPSRRDPRDTSILAAPVLEPVRFTQAPAARPGTASSRARCVAIESERDAVDARMREGYGAGEGEGLRERLRDLRGLWYERRCRRFR